MLEVRKLSKVFEKTKNHALKDVTFSLKEGELLGLIGPNGAGKSTLMKSILGFIHPTSGSVTYKGEDLHQNLKGLSEVGLLLEPTFYDYLTARENLIYLLKLQGKDKYLSEVDEHLSLVGLASKGNSYPRDFSFGMKQRLGLAMALISHPKLLILDEPFVGLDPEGVDELIGVIKKRQVEEQVSAIISSHQLHELSSLCRRVIVLFKGELRFDGIPTYEPTYKVFVEKGGVIESRSIRKNGNSLTEQFRTVLQEGDLLDIEKWGSDLESFFKERP